MKHLWSKDYRLGTNRLDIEQYQRSSNQTFTNSVAWYNDHNWLDKTDNQ